MKQFLFVLVFALPLLAGAQQDPQYSQYVFNPLSVNSGYAGSHDALSVSLIARDQWIGIPGSPQTQSAALHSPLKDRRFAAGITAVHDRYGPVETNALAADFAYRIQLNANTRLSFGVKGSMTFYDIALADLQNTAARDIAFAQNLHGATIPNLGGSVYLWSKTAFLGVSIPRLVEQRIDRASAVLLEGVERRHMFVSAGVVLGAGKAVQFKPTVQVKAVGGAPLSVDLTGNFLFGQRFWLSPTRQWLMSRLLKTAPLNTKSCAT